MPGIMAQILAPEYWISGAACLKVVMHAHNWIFPPEVDAANDTYLDTSVDTNGKSVYGSPHI
jgi:hypothetical protein